MGRLKGSCSLPGFQWIIAGKALLGNITRVTGDQCRKLRGRAWAKFGPLFALRNEAKTQAPSTCAWSLRARRSG